ncbi:hypothetical protein BS78_07G013400 [Paspalum vaginatum]|nr:hypothetical protein BS78_07G013400 [Paspalum vaginatum]
MDEAASTDRRSPEEEARDLLSHLPTDVLVSILEKLDLRAALRTAVLSRGWRCLPKQLPRLVLDINHFLAPDDIDPAPDDDPQSYHAALSEAGDKMVDVAEALLASTRRPDDNDAQCARATLAMRFYLRHSYWSLGRLLDGAVAGGKVHAVELTLTTTCREPRYDSELTKRALARYGLRFRHLFDACPAAFGALTRLKVERMSHDDRPNELGDILAACTRLEKLSLVWCSDLGLGQPNGGGEDDQERWEVRHARLTDITIYCCAIDAVDLVWVPRLERFSFTDWRVPEAQQDLITFGHVPRLTTVALSNNAFSCERAIRLSRTLANTALTDLRLNFYGGNIWVQPEIPRRLANIFCNLKKLKIRNAHKAYGLTWAMFLLESAPHLQELYIKVMDHDCNEHARKKMPCWEVASSFKHYNLARVTILVFYSVEETTVVAFIRHLVEVAVNLEELSIRENPAASVSCKSCGTRSPGGSSFPRTDQEKDAFRKRINGGRSATAAALKIHIEPIAT